MSNLPNTIALKAEVAIAAASDAKRPRATIDPAYSGGIVRVGGFGPILIDLAGMELPDSLPLLADHDQSLNSIVGSAKPSISNNKLVAHGDLTAATPAGANALALARDGMKLAASIGAEPIEYRAVPPGEKVKANGGTHAGPFTFVTKSRLREISIVAIGADSTAAVSIAAKALTVNAQPGDLVISGDPHDYERVRKLALAAWDAHESLRIEFPNRHVFAAAIVQQAERRGCGSKPKVRTFDHPRDR